MSELRIDDVVEFHHRTAGDAMKPWRTSGATRAYRGVITGIDGRRVSVLSGALVFHLDASAVRLVERAP